MRLENLHNVEQAKEPSSRANERCATTNRTQTEGVAILGFLNISALFKHLFGRVLTITQSPQVSMAPGLAWG